MPQGPSIAATGASHACSRPAGRGAQAGPAEYPASPRFAGSAAIRIDGQRLRPSAPPVHDVLTLGFVGRIHEEKGLRLLAAAARLVAATPGLPPWRLLFCGPEDVARGGSGPAFRAGARSTSCARSSRRRRVVFVAPQFDDDALARVYQSIDLFCYPSQAEQGETFGVAVTEAMAAGAVPVVSALACFTDFIRDGTNGLIFDHRAADAPARLAAALVRLLQDAPLRCALVAAAATTAQRYDYGTYADWLLADFAQLTGQGPSPSSPA